MTIFLHRHDYLSCSPTIFSYSPTIFSYSPTIFSYSSDCPLA